MAAFYTADAVRIEQLINELRAFPPGHFKTENILAWAKYFNVPPKQLSAYTNELAQIVEQVYGRLQHQPVAQTAPQNIPLLDKQFLTDTSGSIDFILSRLNPLYASFMSSPELTAEIDALLRETLKTNLDPSFIPAPQPISTGSQQLQLSENDQAALKNLQAELQNKPELLEPLKSLNLPVDSLKALTKQLNQLLLALSEHFEEPIDTDSIPLIEILLKSESHLALTREALQAILSQSELSLVGRENVIQKILEDCHAFKAVHTQAKAAAPTERERRAAEIHALEERLNQSSNQEPSEADHDWAAQASELLQSKRAEALQKLNEKTIENLQEDEEDSSPSVLSDNPFQGSGNVYNGTPKPVTEYYCLTESSISAQHRAVSESVFKQRLQILQESIDKWRQSNEKDELSLKELEGVLKSIGKKLEDFSVSDLIELKRFFANRVPDYALDPAPLFMNSEKSLVAWMAREAGLSRERALELLSAISPNWKNMTRTDLIAQQTLVLQAKTRLDRAIRRHLILTPEDKAMICRGLRISESDLNSKLNTHEKFVSHAKERSQEITVAFKALQAEKNLLLHQAQALDAQADLENTNAAQTMQEVHFEVAVSQTPTLGTPSGDPQVLNHQIDVAISTQAILENVVVAQTLTAGNKRSRAAQLKNQAANQKAPPKPTGEAAPPQEQPR